MRSPLAQCLAFNLDRQIDRIQEIFQLLSRRDSDKTPRGATEIGGFVTGHPIQYLRP
jgi:hypothetical protein